MGEESSAPNTAAEPAEPEYVEPPDVDFALQSLIMVVRSYPGIEIGVTLTIGGMLVTGTLIDGSKFFKEMLESVASAPGGQQSYELIAGTFKTVADLYEKPFETGDNLPMYLHLRDAQFFPSNVPVPSGKPGMLWRGRVSEVQGFTLGNIGPAPAEEA